MFPGQKLRKQIVLDGPVSCGKSIALAMLVHWARSEGWLVFYVPNGKEWTHGGLFYKQPQTGLWDTPPQAAKILQVCFCFFFLLNEGFYSKPLGKFDTSGIFETSSYKLISLDHVGMVLCSALVRKKSLLFMAELFC